MTMFWVYFSLLCSCFVIPQIFGKAILKLDESENLLLDMDIAMHLLTKTKISYTKDMAMLKTMNPRRPLDCKEVLYSGRNQSGIYTIWPRSRVTGDKALEVFCDMDTDGGGWTVLQRRGDFQRPIDYFNKDWESYKKGFGDLYKEFWLGNDNIFALTNQRAYSVRFDLENIAGERRYALYDSFWIDDEDHKYKLHIYDYSGDAGDSMTNYHNNMRFSTKDQENDISGTQNCGFDYKAGWWYRDCYVTLLNGLNHQGMHESAISGINWGTWTFDSESLKATEIKIR